MALKKAIFLFTDPTGLDWVVSSYSFVDLAHITQLILDQTHIPQKCWYAFKILVVVTFKQTII
jgi:hypothetical protein